MSIRKITIVGSGNVAEALGLFFKKENIDICEIHSRNELSGKKLSEKLETSFCSSIENLKFHTGLFLLAVPDKSIAKVAKSLPYKIKEKSIVAHCSGATPLSSISKSCEKAAVFYPLQTFTKGRRLSSKKIPFLISAEDDRLSNKLITLANSLSKTTLIIDDVDRKKLHLSAVFINNFVNHLLTISKEYVTKEGLDFKLLKPLLAETIKKANVLGPDNAQTGPAKRNDQKTIGQHKKLLKKYPALLDIYELMTADIFQHFNK